MDEPQAQAQSDLTRIFTEYRAKLFEIDKKSSEMYPPPVYEESDNSVENNYKRLAEIIVEGHQESLDIPEEVEPPVDRATYEVVNELELKVQEAKTIIGAYEKKLNIKYEGLNKLIADTRKRLEYKVST